MTTESLQGKRIGILGFARQGQALARWLPTMDAAVLVSDAKSAEQLNINPADYPGVEFQLGDQQADFPADLDTLCVSGGVPLDIPLVQSAIQRGIPLTNDAQFFLELCPAPVIGITGSAGKTTTTSLVGEIIRQAGHTTWVGGNIGAVLLDVLADIQPDDRVVMELSSFQLELMTRSPSLAAILNITPNHLDRHGTMENYTAAKANLIAHQTPADTAVLGYDDAGSRELGDQVIGKTVWFSMREMVADGAFMAGKRLLVAGIASPDGTPQVVCERGDIPLRGDHNVLNVLAACAITGAAGIPPEAMRQAIIHFQPVPHRQEVVRVLNDITYINDSIATAPERVVAALRSYREPLILLAGGKDKNLPWDEMLRLALHQSRHIIVFGAAGDMIMERLRVLTGDPEPEVAARVQTLEEAVALAASLAQAGDIVLLSPGGTSYDAYPDFVARGEHFRQLVTAL